MFQLDKLRGIQPWSVIFWHVLWATGTDYQGYAYTRNLEVSFESAYSKKDENQGK